MMDFKKLEVWQIAHQLTLEVYRVTRSFPSEERFGLRNQLRRAASSVPSNIAEGCGRDTQADLRRLMGIAAGSATEMEYQLLLTRDLGYISPETHQRLDSETNRVKKMLNSYMRRIAGDASPKTSNRHPHIQDPKSKIQNPIS